MFQPKFIFRITQGFKQNFYRRFHPGIWTISAINLIGAIGFSLSIPFIALYLHQDRGIPMTTIGLILLVGGLLSAVTQILGGELSDKFGRRPIFILSISVRILMYSLIAIFMAMSAPVWTIALAYILGQSIGMVTMSLTSAIVVDLAPKKRLVEAYGLQRVGLNVGWAAGPAVGGYLATFLPYSWLFAAAAVITAVSLPLVKFFLKESSPKKTERFDYSAMLSVARDRMFLMFIFLSFLVFLTMGQMLSTLSIFAVDRIGLTTAQYGLLLTVNGLMVILFQYPIARLIGRFPLVRALIVGSFLYGLGYLLLGWVGGFILAAVSMVIVTAGEIIFSPSALSIVGKLSPARHRGRYMGFFGLGQTLGWTAAPLIGGILLDVFPVDYLAIWGTIALIAFLATAGFYWWGKHRPS